MAVPEQIPYVGYIANGVTNEFDITFDLHDPQFLIVALNKEIPILGGYTVDIANQKVIFGVAPSTGDQVEFYRDTKLDRVTEYKSYDNSFRPEALNWDLDKIWMALQEQNLIDSKILARLKSEIEWRRTHDFNYDELAQVREKQLFDALKGYTDTLNAATNPGVFQGVIAGVVFARDGKSIQTHLEEIIDNLVVSREDIDSKAGQQYVDEQLNLKAPLTTTNDLQEKKADLTYVNSIVSAAAEGTIPYQTEAELLLSKPTQAKVLAKALNTRHEFLWVRTSAEGVTPITGTWTDTGLSDLDQAKGYADEKIAFEDGFDIAVLRDADGKSVYRIKKDGKIYIIGLGSDIASSINDLNSLIAVTDSENLIELHDINGNKTIIQNKKGELILPTIGNLTLALKDLSENSKNNELSLKNAYLSGKYADYVLTENMPNFEHTDYLLKASEVHAMGIFPHSVSLLRIPAITRISKNKYLLFFEARQNGDDFGMNSQGVATVTVEETTGLASVSNVQCLHAAFTDSENKLRTFMNACAVKLDNNRIICLYVRRYGLTEHELYQRYSDDDGVNWSEYEDITSVKGSTGWNVLAPCSQGLVKRHGQHKGRVVFPLWTTGVAYNASQFRSGYIYSDDNGETWNLGEFADYSTANEVQCAEDLNGDMLFSIRLESRNPPKVLARHSDATKEYSEIKPNKSLTSEAIMSGLIQGENQFDKTANKFQLTACNTTSRKELLIHTSYDGGENWITHLLPTTIDQPVAYSCIENLSASKKFLLWEADSTTNLKYSVVALTNLINQGQ